MDAARFPDPILDPADGSPIATAVLAGGCFWCTEAVFAELDGVKAVRPGYAGGRAEDASYYKVAGGRTDHAEAIEITYDPSRVSFGRLLKVFFSVAHDPTQVDGQGADRGRQYRSAIFPVNDTQREVANGYIRQLTQVKAFDVPIATTVEPLDAFYVAEAEHHDYAARNPNQPYIRVVSDPKVKKLRTSFADYLKQKADEKRAAAAAGGGDGR